MGFFHCNSCDITICKNSRNRHLLTKGHLANAEKIPFEAGRIITIDEYSQNEKECASSSVLKKIQIINCCNICKVRDDGTNFYYRYITLCKSCKNAENKKRIEINKTK